MKNDSVRFNFLSIYFEFICRMQSIIRTFFQMRIKYPIASIWIRYYPLEPVLSYIVFLVPLVLNPLKWRLYRFAICDCLIRYECYSQSICLRCLRTCKAFLTTANVHSTIHSTNHKTNYMRQFSISIDFVGIPIIDVIRLLIFLNNITNDI